jgi:Ca2+-binding RTX toxin-like protein
VIAETASYYKTGSKNLDVLQLGAGLQASATQVTRGVGSNSNDLTLAFGGGDQITLRSYFNSTYRLQTIQFADGTKWDYPTVASKLVYNGTAGNDTLTGLTDAPNVINGGDGNDVLNAGSLNDTLAGGTGNDTLNAGSGVDTFIFNRGDGQDVIAETAAPYKTGGKNLDVLQMGTGIASDQLWFRHIGNNLEIDVIGTTDSVTVTNWYSGSTYHVSQVAANGQTLLDTQVENLVSAMALFSPPAAGQTTLPDNYRTDLASVLAANWK